MSKLFEATLAIVTILVIALGIGAILFLVYGHLTQYDTITFKVASKDTYTSTTTTCDKIGEIMTCTPTTSTYYHIFSSNEQFSTSRKLYHKIVVGKKHTVYVTGWTGARRIWKVLE